jgi:hypothetical protein
MQDRGNVTPAPKRVLWNKGELTGSCYLECQKLNFRVSAIVQTYADNGMTLNFVEYLYRSAFECSLA